LRRGEAAEMAEARFPRRPVPDPGRERELLALARDGDRSARDELVVGGLRLVVSVARRYPTTPALGLEDLVGYGVPGLIAAIDRFDFTLTGPGGRPVRFTSFAVPRIRGAISRAYYTYARTIRLPENVQVDARRIREAGGEVPPWMDVRAVSDYAVGDDDSPTAVGLAVDYRGTGGGGPPGSAESRDAVDRLLSRLEPRRAEVVRMRFGVGGRGPMSQDEVGRALGITGSRVGQIEEEAMTRLRQLAGVATGPPPTTAPAGPPPLADDDRRRLRQIAARRPGDSPARVADRFAREWGWRPELAAVARAIR
jgi:RNA polymerase primary sigma factor